MLQIIQVMLYLYRCWLNYDKGFFWSFLGPVCCILGVSWEVNQVHKNSGMGIQDGGGGATLMMGRGEVGAG